MVMPLSKQIDSLNLPYSTYTTAPQMRRMKSSVTDAAKETCPLSPLLHTMQGRLNSILSDSGITSSPYWISRLEPKSALDAPFQHPRLRCIGTSATRTPRKLGNLAQR